MEHPSEVDVTGDLLDGEGRVGLFSGTLDKLSYGQQVRVKYKKEIYYFQVSLDGRVLVW